eukprot:129515-Rhodomonas_salina.2
MEAARGQRCEHAWNECSRRREHACNGVMSLTWDRVFSLGYRTASKRHEEQRRGDATLSKSMSSRLMNALILHGAWSPGPEPRLNAWPGRMSNVRSRRFLENLQLDAAREGDCDYELFVRIALKPPVAATQYSDAVRTMPGVKAKGKEAMLKDSIGKPCGVETFVERFQCV